MLLCLCNYVMNVVVSVRIVTQFQQLGLLPEDHLRENLVSNVKDILVCHPILRSSSDGLPKMLQQHSLFVLLAEIIPSSGTSTLSNWTRDFLTAAASWVGNL